MPSAAPRVSIGLPVYNGQAFLREAVESLLQQTYTNLQLLICDNASSDDTEVISRAFEKQDNRVVYHRAPENRGAIWNFNRAFELARSPYFKWAAADDVYAATYVEKCVARMEEDPAIAWCHSLTSHIDVEGRPIQAKNATRISYTSRESDDAVQRLNSVLFASSCLDSYGLMRADMVRQTRMLLPYFGSEKVFMAELALLGPYREVPEELFFSRIHPDLAGGLQSAAEQQEFIDPRLTSPVRFTRFRLLGYYASAIRRSRLPWAVKLAAYRSLVRYVFQINKWKRVFVKTILRKGTGGDIQVSAS